MHSCPSPQQPTSGGLSQCHAHATGRRSADFSLRPGLRPGRRQPLVCLERYVRRHLGQRLHQRCSVHPLSAARRRLQQLPPDCLCVGWARRTDHGYRRPVHPQLASQPSPPSRHPPFLPLVGHGHRRAGPHVRGGGQRPGGLRAHLLLEHRHRRAGHTCQRRLQQPNHLDIPLLCPCQHAPGHHRYCWRRRSCTRPEPATAAPAGPPCRRGCQYRVCSAVTSLAVNSPVVVEGEQVFITEPSGTAVVGVSGM